MSLIQKFMGRRQFLMAAGLASGCALTCKKLAGFMDRSAQAGTAMAASKAFAASKAAGNRCPHLLSPLKIRNVVLKNRIMHTVSPTYFMQGSENFPAAMYRNHYSNMAKNAAIVSMSTHYGTYPKTYVKGQHGPSANFCDDIWEDIPPVENYVERLMEDIHCEGALILHAGATGGQGAVGMPGAGIVPDANGEGGLALGGPGGGMPGGEGGMPGGAPGGMPGGMPGGEGGLPGGMPPGGGMPGGTGGMEGGRGGMEGGRGPGMTIQSKEEILADAKEAEETGYDVFRINTDDPDVAAAVRNSTNLVLMASLRVGRSDMMSSANSYGVTNDNQPTKDELEQAVEQARKLEGIADFLWIRIHEHPNAWIQDKERPIAIGYADAIKKAGIKILTCPSAGFHDSIQNDEFIAKGLTDMVGMTTPLFADAELVRKLQAGRADDVIPCISCHNCHGISMSEGPWYSTCTVNPTWGLPPYKLQGITPPKMMKKVAVIGGGPAGMKAALVAAERGHKVTLYEKSDALGGLLKIADNSKWRWNFKDFKEYLVNQVNKAGIEVKLGAEAKPETIKKAGYDTVLVATGAEPVVSRMKGADADNVFNILEAYSKKDKLGKNVVMIGAGKYGFECALGMAKDGHKVTELTTGNELYESAFVGPHNMQNQQNIYRNHPNYSYELGVMIKSITGGKVTYTDNSGNEKSVKADSIVMYSGLRPMTEEASEFFGTADEVYLLGDCTGKNGHLQLALRSAFFTASQV